MPTFSNGTTSSSWFNSKRPSLAEERCRLSRYPRLQNYVKEEVMERDGERLILFRQLSYLEEVCLKAKKKSSSEEWEKYHSISNEEEKEEEKEGGRTISYQFTSQNHTTMVKLLDIDAILMDCVSQQF